MAGEHILVVEDQRAVAGALQLRLRGLGYDVMAVARDAKEAIEKDRELNPDLILMDIKLGEGMDGIEAAQRIRERRNVPVVFLSAYADTKLLQRARTAKPAGFINKPFTTKDLLTAIDLALFYGTEDGARIAVPLPTSYRDETEGIVTTDIDGRITFVNSGAERLLGARRQQLSNRPLTDVLQQIHRLESQAAHDVVDRVLTQGTEESLVRSVGRGPQAAGREVVDSLTALRDSRGNSHGLALRFAQLEPTPRPPVAGAESNLEVALARALDAMPIALVLVDRDLSVIHLNRRAGDLIRANHSVDVRSNRLSFRDKNAQEALERMVADAVAKASTEDDDYLRSATFFKPEQKEQSLEWAVAPAASEGSEQTSLALVYLFDPSFETVLSAGVLTNIYSLTNTEARLVQVMSSGRTLDDVATQLEISVNTARTHLKHIFHKTSINRQTELVHRVETGPASLLLDYVELASGD